MNTSPDQKKVINQAFGARIRTLRKARGWSLTDLARLYGGGRPYLYQIERGEASPSLAMIAKLADAFGLPIVALIDDAGDDEVARDWSDAYVEAVSAAAVMGAALARFENALDLLHRAEAARKR